MSEIFNSYPKTFTVPEGAVKFKVVVHNKALADLSNIDVNAYQTTLITEEFSTEDMPFSTELPDLDHKFQVVRGTGCEINLISDTDMRFFNGLYHTDKKEFLVKHYIDGLVNWVGYLNSEMNRESYSESFNYPVQVTGNDGFALMDRIQFLDDTGAIFTGIKSQFEIIQIIFNKIGLPFQELRVCLATTSPALNIGAYSTILHHSYIDCANFYDEDGTAMTLREVLEAILKPYGAFITQTAGNITITDIHILATGLEMSFNCYSMTDWLYTNNITINPLKSIAGIGYMGTGAEIEISGGKNKQVVSYSPYPIKNALPETLKDLIEFAGVPAFYSIKNTYHYRTLTSHDILNEIAPATFEMSYGAYEQESQLYLRFPRQTTQQKIAEIKINPYLYLSQASISTLSGSTRAGNIRIGVAFLITGNIRVTTKADTYDEATGSASVTMFELNTKLRVGNKYAMDGVRTPWTLTDSFLPIKTNKTDNSTFADVWAPIGIGGKGLSVPVLNYIDTLDANLSGAFYLDIYSDFKHSKDGNGIILINSTEIIEVWIQNLAVKIVDINTLSEIAGTDTEYIGYLNPSFKDEAEKTELSCGTDVTRGDKGKIMYLDGDIYKPIQAWTRVGQTYKIEELLLRSLSSNYRTGYRTLNNMKLKNNFDQLSVLTDEPFLPGKKFMVKSSTVNYRDNLIESSLVEITPDELTLETDVVISSLPVPKVSRNKRIYQNVITA